MLVKNSKKKNCMHKPYLCDFEDLLLLFVYVRTEIYFYTQVLIKVY